MRLSDELAEHGVDAVRLTMVFAGPPEDDIDWADVSPAGSAQVPGARVAAGRRRDLRRSAPTPATGDVALRRVTHRSSHEATTPVERCRFNVAVARLMELVNAPRKAIDDRAWARPTRRSARRVEAVAVMLSLFAPYTAEEMWAAARPPAVRWPAPAGRRSTRRCSSRRR